MAVGTKTLGIPAGGGGIKDLWIYITDTNASYLGTFNFASVFLSNNNNRRVTSTIKLPPDFVSLIALYPVLGAVGIGDIYRQNAINYFANGENFQVNQVVGAAGVINYPVVNLMVELEDISALFPAGNPQPGDYIGISFVRDATQVTDTLEDNVLFIGWRMVYQAR